MTYEEFTEDWFNQKHPFVQAIYTTTGNISPDSKQQRDIDMKLDWLEYCSKNNLSAEKSFTDELFDTILNYIGSRDANSISNLDSISLAYIYINAFYKYLATEIREAYDTKLLSRVTKLLSGNNTFEAKKELFLSWVNIRVDMLCAVQLGIPAYEAHDMYSFYQTNRNSFIYIRNTDYPTMNKIAFYFQFLYESCKTIDRRMMAGDIVRLHNFLLAFMHDLLSSARINAYDTEENRILDRINELEAETSPRPSVFISYTWKDAAIADQIESSISDYATIHRDSHDLQPGDSLSAFMKTIRKQDFVILLVSDDYLKRRNCMYEVLQLLKDYDEHDQSFWEKVIMYVTATDIYSTEKQNEIIKYWSEIAKDLEKDLDGLPLDATEEMVKELKTIKSISMEIGKLLFHIKDELCELDLDKFISNAKNALSQYSMYGDNVVSDCLLALFQTQNDSL